MVYGFTPRGDSRGPDSFLHSYGLSLLSAIPRSRAARLRGARCRGSAMCAEFESSCNKIRALCDGLRYPARARVRLAHIYPRKSEMYTGRLRVYGGYLSPFACPDISVARCTRATASRPADVNNTTKSLPDTYVFFFFTFSSFLLSRPMALHSAAPSLRARIARTSNASICGLVKTSKIRCDYCNNYNNYFLFVLPLRK